MSLSLHTLRLSTAELLAYAVTDLFPEAKLIEGETTDFGFHYDFHITQPVDDYVITLIEEKMRSLIKENLPVRSLDMMRENAVTLFQHRGQDIKAEIISQETHNIVPIMQIGDFYDYCPPPYISNTQEIAAFKIIKVESASIPISGEDIPVVRFSGVVFHDKISLKKSLKAKEETKKRDHRVLGKEMNLFSGKDEVGLGCWLWHPKGTLLRQLLIDWWKGENNQRKFEFLTSPNLVKASLMQKSGLFGNRFREEPLPVFSLEGVDYTWRAALSPFHALFFKSTQHSYRALPIRYAECAEIFTNQRNRQLWGLLQARTSFTDVAHTFCSPKQVVSELISSLQFIDRIIKMLGFEYHWCLGSRGQKYSGTLASWDEGFAWIVQALEACEFKYVTDPLENARFGPFVEARLVDSLGREWQGPQVTIDLNSPERYVLRYQESNGEMYAPVMIAESLFRSLERFIAMLIEHYGGAFPLWIAPEQIRIIPVAERNASYGNKVYSSFEKLGFRASIDDGIDPLGSKVHKAEREKVPYMVIVGDKEEKTNAITVRSLNQGEVRASFDLDSFLAKVQEEVLSKALPDTQRNQ